MLIGPTSRPWNEIADEVTADLDRLSRPGVELAYRCTGSGPRDVHTLADAVAAAPGVVATARAAEREGFDGVIVDCTEDPGVADASRLVPIPVVGAGAALASAIADAPRPLKVFSGDELRALDSADLERLAAGAATVALGATGWSHLADRIRALQQGVVVLDPLELALDACLDRIDTESLR